VESIFVLNDIERAITERLIRKLSTGDIPAKAQYSKIHLNYEYRCGKNEKVIRGSILDCRYKLRYRDIDHIYFSAWDCTDVCGIFYDAIGIIYMLTEKKEHFIDFYDPFDVDLRTERYVFFGIEAAASFVSIADHIVKNSKKIYNSGQYVLSAFDELDKSKYDALIQKFKTEGYSKIQILQIWIRGEIRFYAIVDDMVLRPEHQRTLNFKEEKDLIRKIGKSIKMKNHISMEEPQHDKNI
jgi:hypothetical protein